MLNEPVGHDSDPAVLRSAAWVAVATGGAVAGPAAEGTPVDRAEFMASIVNARPELSLVGGYDGMDIGHPEEEWQDRALCAQTDPEAFFPEKGGSTREAKKICLSCEVRVECLEYALENDERFGIWGGLSERERRRLKKGVI